MTREERLQGLEVDLDVRMTDVWALLWDGPEPEDEALRAHYARILRVAYARGYVDALREEAEGRRGELAERHGFPLPR